MSLTDRATVALQRPPGEVAVPATWLHTPVTGRPAAPDTAFAFTADAGTDLLTTTAHGLVANERIRVASTTTLPAGLAAATDYYVIASGLTANAFKVSATSGGSAIDITGSGTGTHTWTRYLTAPEIAELAPWLAFLLAGGYAPADLTLPVAIIHLAAWQTYYASPAFVNWWHDNQLSRVAQYNLRRVDVAVAAEATIPATATSTGVGSGAVAAPIAPLASGQTADVEFNIDSGTLGGAITLELFSDSPGATIYYRKPAGSGTWLTYHGTPVAMSAGQILEAYDLAPGLTQSDITSFENA